MKTYIADTEVFAHDYIVVFKDKQSKEYHVFHNDPDGVKAMIEDVDNIFAFFNGKHYDRFIVAAICNDGTPETVKQVNDFIISGGHNGWEYPDEMLVRKFICMYDLMDDCQQGLSLKAIEAHLGMNIVESSVDFNLDRNLTAEELEEVISYCKYDVDATDILDDLRQDYLNNKWTLGKQAGIDLGKILYMTNAKMTAAYLNAKAIKTTDERDYKYPATLDLRYIPAEVTAFFDRLHDENIPLEQLYTESLEIMVGDCPTKMGWGGIHGALSCYHEEATDNRSIRNKDVASYYPNQIRINGYCSRAVPDPTVYAAIIDRRIKAKKEGDKSTANALKLVLNSTYGASLNPYNDLYDPLMARSVCISGQLQLLELAQHLIQDCPTLKVIQVNTDGIMVSLDNSDLDKWNEITEEWSKRTGFTLEEDLIKAIHQKDVNNYVEIPFNGEPKIKGGLLVRGIAPAGAFNINNNANIVAKAIKEYFVNQTPVADTINACTEIHDFQLIAKGSSKYSAVYQEINGDMVRIQKVNRVYATKQICKGTLYKRHADTGNLAKIPGLPTHCIVDNDNHLTIDEVYKGWYIKLAEKYVKDFMGIEPPKKNTRKINKLKKELIALISRSENPQCLF